MPNLMVIDVETSGLPKRRRCSYAQLDNFDDSRMIELAYVVYDPSLMEVIKERSWLIRSVDVVENSEIHGISTEDLLRDGVDVREALGEMKEDLASVDTIAAHNIEFDITIVCSEIFRDNPSSSMLGLIEGKQKICTMLYGQEIMRMKKWPKLTELYVFLTGEELVQTHRALDDVRSCARCFDLMFAKL